MSEDHDEYHLLSQIKQANKEFFQQSFSRQRVDSTGSFNERKKSDISISDYTMNAHVKENQYQSKRTYDPYNLSMNTNLHSSLAQNSRLIANPNILPSHQTELINKIQKAKSILAKLRQGLIQNTEIRNKLQKYNSDLHSKQDLIESMNDKIKKLIKTKQKKHVKFNQFIPLIKLYYHSIKKIPRYYYLIELITNTKNPVKRQSIFDTRVQTPFNRQINRFKFHSIEDNLLKLDWKEINWKEISIALSRPIKQCFVRKLELENFFTYEKWTSFQDDILRRAILYYGPRNWQQISYCLEGKNNSQCFHRWMKGINPLIKREKWSLDEDLTLSIALKIYVKNKWAKISGHIPFRTDIQCRERYCNILDPNLIGVQWNESEDLKLVRLVEEYGSKWSLIAKEFGDRTDNTCWRRWKHLNLLTLYSINNDTSFEGIKSNKYISNSNDEQKETFRNMKTEGNNKVNALDYDYYLEQDISNSQEDFIELSESDINDSDNLISKATLSEGLNFRMIEEHIKRISRILKGRSKENNIVIKGDSLEGSNTATKAGRKNPSKGRTVVNNDGEKKSKKKRKLDEKGIEFSNENCKVNCLSDKVSRKIYFQVSVCSLKKTNDRDSSNPNEEVKIKSFDKTKLNQKIKGKR